MGHSLQTGMFLTHVIVILSYARKYVTHAYSPDTSEVVAQCCPSQFTSCCAESVDFLKPLQCDGMKLETRIDVSQCIQKAMHAEQQPVLSLTDTICCDVFADDDNDEKAHCLTECITVMQIPALRNDRKLKRIEKCQRRNPLHQCFNRCLQWRRSTNETFIFEDHCSIEWKMVPGKVYIGPEVR